MYTLTITNFEGRSLKLEVATAAEAYGFKAKFEVLNLDIHVQDDSDLNKEGCYDGGFYDSEEDIAYVNIEQND